MSEDKIVFENEMQERLWKISLELCGDGKTSRIAEQLATL